MTGLEPGRHRGGVGSARRWETFAERLLADLVSIGRRFDSLLEESTIRDVNPNSHYSAVFVLGAADWGWEPNEALIPERTTLLDAYIEWFARFRLLHRKPLPEVQQRIHDADELVRRWLSRDGTWDHSIPQTIIEARTIATATIVDLDRLVRLACDGPSGELLAVPDTNVLLKDPDVAVYGPLLASDAYTAVLLPQVLAELDDLKDRGRTPEVRAAAERAVRRMKGLRDRGDIRSGVTVAGKVKLRVEHRDIDVRDVLDWLNPDVPDDRTLGAALDLQSRQPTSTVVLVTTDFNMQNKAAAAGLPFLDP